MALTFSISITAYTEDLTTGTVTDATTYGGGESERADIGVFLIGFKVDKDAAETNLSIANADAGAATSWTFSLSEDGWYSFTIIAAPDYNAGTTYAAGDCVYDPTGKVMYVSLQGSNTGQSLSDGAWWEQKTVAEVYALLDTASEPSNTGFEFSRLDEVITVYTDRAFSDHTSDNAVDIGNNVNLERNVETYELLGVYLDAMTISCVRNEYVKGEIIARKAEDLIDTL